MNTERKMYWDEDNRLMVLSDNGKTSRYTYNAAGERIVKSHGDLEGVYVNGAPQGITFHETEDYTIYPAPIITVTKNRFTKHYLIGDKRIASKLGTGKFSNVYGVSSNNVTAGQKGYAARMLQIEKQREEYYRKLGTPPGVPTMKGATADPDNTGYGYNTIIGELGDHSVPEGWVQRPKFNKKGDVPGPPIQWQKPEDPDNAQPGYGYVPADTAHHEDIFFYHSDHLGSTSYITDAKANITQFDAYLPYGELLVDEHSSSEEMPYKFNGKEFDQETGLYYYGARYMNPITGLWYGVDALAEKYPSVGGYVYCVDNPVRYTDPMGMEIEEGNLKEWVNLKQKIERQRDNLQTDINKLNAKARVKGWNSEKLAVKIGNKAERLASLNSSIGTMETLEASSQVYSLSHTADGENGGVTLNTNTNVIDIKFGSTANFVHEMTHAGQFETGDVAFLNTGMTILQDVYDETAAYKAQFGYSPSSVSGLTSTSVANSFSEITPAWVQGLKDATGSMPYAEGGSANTGLIPVNINSTRDALIQAYPWKAAELRQLPENYNLRTLQGVYYKR